MVIVSMSLLWGLCSCHYHDDCIPAITLVIVFLSLPWWLQVTSSWWRSPSHCFWHRMTSATLKPTSRLRPQRMESSLATLVKCFLPFRTLSSSQQCWCLMINFTNSTPAAAIVLFRHGWCYIYFWLSLLFTLSHCLFAPIQPSWLTGRQKMTFLSHCLRVLLYRLSFMLSVVSSSCGLVYDMRIVSNSQCVHHVTCVSTVSNVLFCMCWHFIWPECQNWQEHVFFPVGCLWHALSVKLPGVCVSV